MALHKRKDLNELMIQEVERILEAQDRQMSEESQFGPP